MSALAQDAMLGSTNVPTQTADAFQQLVQDLSNVLGPSSGLDSADVDPLDLQKLMEGYTSRDVEWQKYAWGDPSRTYTRNLVDKGNGKSNLVGSQQALSHTGPPIQQLSILSAYCGMDAGERKPSS